MRTFKVVLTLFLAVSSAACDPEPNRPRPGPVIRPDRNATDDDASAGPKAVVFVAPFENAMSAKSYGAYTIGLAALVTERLEAGAPIRTVSSDMVLSEEQARLVREDGTGFDLDRARALAVSKGATHLLTGRISGQTWAFEVEAELHALGRDSPVGRGKAGGDLTTPIKTRTGRTERIISAERLHGIFADAVVGAFAEADMPLDEEAALSIRTPPTGEAYRFLMLSRAYAKVFLGADAEAALEAAARAVSVDPGIPEAQRLYAELLMRAGRGRSARPHFEAAVKLRPDDVRSLARLGQIETEERNVTAARDYLKRAAELRPDDPNIAFRLGEAALAGGDVTAAKSQFERTRTLDPDHAGSRSALARLYAAEKRYGDAADELVHVIRLTEADRETHLTFAACLRAAGRYPEAADAYGRASKLYPGDAVFLKFRGDMLKAAGRDEEAAVAYAAARRLNVFDRRVSKALGKSIMAMPQIGGEELLKAVQDARALRGALDRNRSVFYLGMNDAVLDLFQNRDRACLDGHGASSALMAVQAKQRFDEVREEQAKIVWRVSYARRYGEWQMFTPDELAGAEAVLAEATAARQDATEMDSQYRRAFLPLYVRNRCQTFDGEITAATVASVLERHRTRWLKTPAGRRPPMLPVAPDVPAERALAISFRVDNSEGTEELAIVVDGNRADSVPAGAIKTVRTTVGPHDLCVEADEEACLRPNNVRRIYLHDGWTMRIRKRR